MKKLFGIVALTAVISAQPFVQTANAAPAHRSHTTGQEFPARTTGIHAATGRGYRTAGKTPTVSRMPQRTRPSPGQCWVHSSEHALRAIEFRGAQIYFRKRLAASPIVAAALDSNRFLRVIRGQL